jgi:signal transduction histidine kinase
MGVITFLRTGASEHYTPDDLAVAEQLGRRAGLSVDNARLYQEGQEREAELVRANEAKDEFLGLMSHELRTPITVVHGGARVLRSRGESLDEATRTSMLADIERESDRLARMLENLLALARVELDQEPVVEPVLVQRLLDRLVANYEQGPSHRAIELNAPGNIASVAAEPAYLEHVIRNLISNAEKYSPAGSTIEIQLEQLDQESVAIRVLDHGFGIGQEEAERIFERFYRSDRTAKLAGGAGMGLAVCKRLIEAMSGQIWARPRQGGGLEVGFSLPFYEETES